MTKPTLPANSVKALVIMSVLLVATIALTNQAKNQPSPIATTVAKTQTETEPVAKPVKITKAKEVSPINEVASASQLQADRENACNDQLKKMTINAYVCSTAAKTFTTDLEMSDWMSGIKITYPLRFDKSGNRLPEDDAYLDRVKAFYKAHGQDINIESTFHPSKIIPSPIAHVGRKPSGNIPANCDVWCIDTLNVDVNDIKDIRRFIVDWESRTKGESQAENETKERSDASIHSQFQAIRRNYFKAAPDD